MNKNWNRLRKSKGMTMLELMLAIVVTAIIIFILVRLGGGILDNFRQSRSANESNQAARICLERIGQALSQGKGGTQIMSSPDVLPMIPSSMIRFDGIDGTQFTISQSTVPAYSVRLAQVAPDGTTRENIIGRNVTKLLFAEDARDPLLVYVTLEIFSDMEAQLTNTSRSRLFFSNQLYRMTAAE